MPTAFGGSRNTSTWNKNRVDPFYGYGELDQAGMKPLKQGEQAGARALGFGMDAQKRSLSGYEAMAAGQGPSLATDMMRRQTAQSIAAQQSMAAQAGGAGAFRNAAWQGAAQQAAGNQAIAEMRAQEQQAAMQGAAGMSSQMAGQGLQQQLGYAGMLNQAQISQMQAAADFALQQRALQEQERMGRFQRRMGWANFGVTTTGKVAEAVSSAVSASDERLKTNIAPGQTAASELATAAAPIEFDYTQGAGPEGRRVGVSAQQLEQTPAGRALVIDTPAGKMVDTNQASLAALGIGGEHERRLRALESNAPARGPAIAQPREVIRHGNANYTIDHQLAREAEAAQERLAATSEAIDTMRAESKMPAPAPIRFDAGAVGRTRGAVGSEIDRMQAELDQGNPFGVPGGSKVGSGGSASVNTGQIASGGGGGGGGGQDVGGILQGIGGALSGSGGGGGMGKMMGGGGGGGGFGAGMKGFGAAMSDERRKRMLVDGGESARALAGSIGGRY